MAFWVYILRCADESYYVGHTENLELRVAQHQSGDLGGYTKTRRPVQLVCSESFGTREDAFAAERQIKGWSRQKKAALIAGDWERLRLLGAAALTGPMTEMPCPASAHPSRASG